MLICSLLLQIGRLSQLVPLKMALSFILFLLVSPVHLWFYIP